jgi:hypothetical protein
MNILCIEYFCPQKMQLFSSTAKHGRQFDYWNWPLNICYLLINIENLLCPLQVFHFHLWPIHWLSLVSLVI